MVDWLKPGNELIPYKSEARFITVLKEQRSTVYREIEAQPSSKRTVYRDQMCLGFFLKKHPKTR